MDADTQKLLIGIFWASVAVIAYTFVIYPLALRLAGRFARPWKRGTELPRSVSVVIAVRNEEARKLPPEFAKSLATSRDRQSRARFWWCPMARPMARPRPCTALQHPQVRLLEVSAALRQGGGDQPWLCRGDGRNRHPGRHAANVGPAGLGHTLGELCRSPGRRSQWRLWCCTQSDGALAGVGLYWRLEKWLRRHESELHSCVGVTGAFFAVRRALFRPIPAGTILDDVYWPLEVVLAGYRVVHDEQAQSFDRLPPRSQDEFRRKVRTLAGNFQLLVCLPAALHPWRNPAFVPLVSHKLVPLLVPWAMLGMLVASGLLPGTWYAAALAAQCTAYGCALLGLWSRAAARIPLVSTAAAFLLLNGGCRLALFVWLTGNTSGVWRPVRYEATD